MTEKKKTYTSRKTNSAENVFLDFFRSLFVVTGKFISNIIDKFYPPFKNVVSLQFFRYSASGMLNTVFDWILYFITYNFIIQKKLVRLEIVTLSPHVASLLITFPIVLFSGFLLQKYITFTASKMRGSRQLFRYILVVIVNLLINYLGLKLFVEQIGLYPTPSKMLVTVVTVTVSYFSQKLFTFRTTDEKV